MAIVCGCHVSWHSIFSHFTQTYINTLIIIQGAFIPVIKLFLSLFQIQGKIFHLCTCY